MILIVIKHEERDHFGYAEEEQDLPPGYRAWARIDTRTWRMTFPDGRHLQYNSFREIHDTIGQALLDQKGRELTINQGKDGTSEPVTDAAEQWQDVGVWLEREIAIRDGEEE